MNNYVERIYKFFLRIHATIYQLVKIFMLIIPNRFFLEIQKPRTTY